MEILQRRLQKRCICSIVGLKRAVHDEWNQLEQALLLQTSGSKIQTSNKIEKNMPNFAKIAIINARSNL